MTDSEPVAALPEVVTVTTPHDCCRCKCRSNRVAFIKKGAIVNVVCEACLRRPRRR